MRIAVDGTPVTITNPAASAPVEPERSAPTETEILRRAVEDALHVSFYNPNAAQHIRAILRDGLSRAAKTQENTP